jgi:hypothetical protein
MQTFTVEIDGVRLPITRDMDGAFLIPEHLRGLGNSLKPAIEPICLARKPLSEKTIAANVLRWGVGALNIDGCRVGVGVLRSTGDGKRDRTDGYGMQGGVVGGSELGRWPANVIHDGSDEVVGAFPESKSNDPGTTHVMAEGWGHKGERKNTGYAGEYGSAARFFYTAKADADDRLGSKHPTVKPLDLIQYLIRLITPKGGTVLDMFAGTGTTAEAALREGMRCILVEREPEYQSDIERRMAHVFDGEVGRSVAIAKARPQKGESMPLFPEAAE